MGLETQLHHHFAHQRVNWVNNQCEFFYVTPADVRTALADLRGDILSYVEGTEADEWHQSETARQQTAVS